MHGHIEGRSDGLVDDGRGLGDTQPLKGGLTNHTIHGTRTGVHEIVEGRLQFRMTEGRMSSSEQRQLQENLNRQQEEFYDQ